MDKTKEILEKQLQVLFERVDKWNNSPQDLYVLSKAMCEVARQLQNLSGDAQGWLASVQLSAKELADICAGQYARTRRQQETSRRKSEHLEKCI